MIYQEEAIASVAKELIRTVDSKILCFYGAMGAGKTTLIKALVHELHGAETASSPTFGIVNEYHTSQGELLGYHFDFYRLENENEALDLGFEDYLNQDVWVFIEWPEKIPSFIPENATNIQITSVNQQTRKITF